MSYFGIEFFFSNKYILEVKVDYLYDKMINKRLYLKLHNQNITSHTHAYATV